MYNARLENQLMIVGIVDAMQDYCSIQVNIDESKVKAAALIAQKIDLKRTLKDDLNRCLDPQTEADLELKELVIPALCYFTYSRCLRLFQGVLTDGGFLIEGEAADKNIARAVANEMSAVAESFLQEAIDFLKLENPNTEVTEATMTPQVRVFGGEEWRASN